MGNIADWMQERRRQRLLTGLTALIERESTIRDENTYFIREPSRLINAILHQLPDWLASGHNRLDLTRLIQSAITDSYSAQHNGQPHSAQGYLLAGNPQLLAQRIIAYLQQS